MKRVKRKTTVWHVFSRGARRLGIFWDEQDYRTFLGILKKALDATGCSLWAYVLMSNHYHFVIQATTEELTSCMRRVNYLYSKYHNDRHGLSGHTFDGPYRAYAQGTVFLMLWRIAYVFLNPVEAGVVTRPEGYEWSSYRSFMGLPGSPLGLNPLPALSKLDRNLDRARQKFRAIMERQAAMPARKALPVREAVQVQSEQFLWLLERAREMRSKLGDVDPVAVAMIWAKACGIRPRAVALSLDGRTASQVASQMDYWSRRVAEDPKLRSAWALP